MKRTTILAIFCLFCLLLITSALNAQDKYVLWIANESISGTDLVFDIYMKRTGSQLYLADADLKLDFNLANFTAPTLVSEVDGLNGFYTIATDITSGIVIVNILKPGFSTQAQFDARVINVSTISEFIGRFHITGVTNQSGTSGLHWRYPGHPGDNSTVVTELTNTTPWLQTNATSTSSASYIDSDTPLPITLGSFRALPVAQGSGVKLEWTTISETNNYGFEVERSTAISGPFEMVPGSFVAGNGTTLTPHSYSFTDNAPGSGRMYYRLKQIDLDRSVHYSEVISLDVTTSVEEQKPTAFALQQNFPNPFNPATTIRFALPSSQAVTLIVYDLAGRVVGTLVNGVLSAGFYEKTFDASNLASGVYVYRLKAGSFVETKKLVLIR